MKMTKNIPSSNAASAYNLKKCSIGGTKPKPRYMADTFSSSAKYRTKVPVAPRSGFVNIIKKNPGIPTIPSVLPEKRNLKLDHLPSQYKQESIKSADPFALILIADSDSENEVEHIKSVPSVESIHGNDFGSTNDEDFNQSDDDSSSNITSSSCSWFNDEAENSEKEEKLIKIIKKLKKKIEELEIENEKCDSRRRRAVKDYCAGIRKNFEQSQLIRSLEEEIRLVKEQRDAAYRENDDLRHAESNRRENTHWVTAQNGSVLSLPSEYPNCASITFECTNITFIGTATSDGNCTMIMPVHFIPNDTKIGDRG